MKISIVCRTFRTHDNPFLDSDIYIIYIDKEEYGKQQLGFLYNILKLHLEDLKKYNVKPFITHNIKEIYRLINNDDDVYVDYYNPVVQYEVDVIFVPTWTLIDWTDKVDMVKEWFLPEALRNHDDFKEYTHKNRRSLYKSKKKTSTMKTSKNNFKLKVPDTPVPLPEKNLDSWIRKKLKAMKYMSNKKWYKPNTNPFTSIKDDDDDIPPLNRSSKLSPFVALGVISPLMMYEHFTGETRMGSGRDQLLFREMFHACGQMKEFWKNSFGKSYDWKPKTKRVWNEFLSEETEYKDLNFAVKQIKKEGWIHHLARHIIADYITRGGLELHWKHGMNWFKEVLIDHDAAVNRANWMWLSGTAFSSKQRSSIYHYNPDTYLTRILKKIN